MHWHFGGVTKLYLGRSPKSAVSTWVGDRGEPKQLRQTFSWYFAFNKVSLNIIIKSEYIQCL